MHAHPPPVPVAPALEGMPLSGGCRRPVEAHMHAGWRCHVTRLPFLGFFAIGSCYALVLNYIHSLAEEKGKELYPRLTGHAPERTCSWFRILFNTTTMDMDEHEIVDLITPPTSAPGTPRPKRKRQGETVDLTAASPTASPRLQTCVFCLRKYRGEQCLNCDEGAAQ